MKRYYIQCFFIFGVTAISNAQYTKQIKLGVSAKGIHTGYEWRVNPEEAKYTWEVFLF